MEYTITQELFLFGIGMGISFIFVLMYTIGFKDWKV